MKVSAVRIQTMLILTSLLVEGCVSASRLPAYPLRSLDQYPHALRADRLVLVAEAIRSSAQQEAYFGTNLTSEGILPVFVVVSNSSTGGSVLVDPQKTSLVAPSMEAKPGEHPIASDGTIPTGLLAATYAGGVAVALGSVVAMPLMIATGVMIGNRVNVQAHLQSQALRSQTVSPGKTVHGVQYFPVPDRRVGEGLGLRISLTDLSSQEVKTYVVELSEATSE
jgi:hypothetical protein